MPQPEPRPRPYINENIEGLEKIFEQNKDNINILDDLQYELSNRPRTMTGERGRTLYDHIQVQLNNLQSQP